MNRDERHELDHVCDPYEVECLHPAHGPVYAPGCEPAGHLDRAADLVLAVVATRDPGYPVGPEAHDTLVDLLESVVSAIVVGRS